jgi:O-antigen ligase
LLGTGFGHEYVEQVRADDISHAFALYRYIPHNSILGIWAFTGLVGFTALWLPMMMGLFMAARAYRRATRPLVRAGLLTVAAMVVIHLIQAWGDMGIQAWPGVFLMGACIALAGQLAVELGAYPAPPARRARRRAAPSPVIGQAAPAQR